jgi:hypothetical protein
LADRAGRGGVKARRGVARLESGLRMVSSPGGFEVFTELFPPAPPRETPREPHVHDWRHAGMLVREALCAVHGHDYRRHSEGTRLFLRCAECGHETHGWYIDVHD